MKKIILILTMIFPFSVFAIEQSKNSVDLYDLILLILKWFPATGPHLVSLGAFLAGLVLACTALIGALRIIVKITFWTKKDNELLEKLENFYLKISSGPLKPIFLLIDRLSLLKDGIK